MQESIWYIAGKWIVDQVPFLDERMAAPLGIFIGAFVVLNMIMGVVTFMILWLRKLLGWMQSRLGPKHVGWHGMLQTIADAIKLLTKENTTPLLADKWVFTIAPGIVFITAYMVYVTIPLGPRISVIDLNMGILYVTAVSSVVVIGIILGGWASNNKYALLSAFRSAAQMVSYEIPFALATLGPVMLAGTLSFTEVVNNQSSLIPVGSSLGWFVVSQPIIFLVFLLAGLAENNITPFDIVEADSEIVAGYHIEYSGMKFALFFLAEFANTLTLAILTTLIFLGGWHDPFGLVATGGALAGLGAGVKILWGVAWFGLKVGALISLVFWIRGSLPRVRVDQLMDMGWKVLIPITLINLFVVGAQVAFSYSIWVTVVINWVLLIGIVFILGPTFRRTLDQVELHHPERQYANQRSTS